MVCWLTATATCLYRACLLALNKSVPHLRAENRELLLMQSEFAENRTDPRGIKIASVHLNQ